MTKNHPTMQCRVLELRYSFVHKTGTLHMVDGDCCDMSGCVDAFKAIDGDVARIVTYSGNRADTSYILTKEGWEAKWPPG